MRKLPLGADVAEKRLVELLCHRVTDEHDAERRRHVDQSLASVIMPCSATNIPQRLALTPVARFHKLRRCTPRDAKQGKVLRKRVVDAARHRWQAKKPRVTRTRPHVRHLRETCGARRLLTRKEPHRAAAQLGKRRLLLFAPGAAGYSVSNSMQFSGPRLVKSSHLVLVSMCTARCPSGLGAGASTGAGAGKGSWDSVRCERGSHVVAKAGRRPW